MNFTFLPQTYIGTAAELRRGELETRSAEWVFLHLRIKNFLSFHPFLIQLPFLFESGSLCFHVVVFVSPKKKKSNKGYNFLSVCSVLAYKVDDKKIIPKNCSNVFHNSLEIISLPSCFQASHRCLPEKRIFLACEEVKVPKYFNNFLSGPTYVDSFRAYNNSSLNVSSIHFYALHFVHSTRDNMLAWLARWRRRE